MFDSSEHPGHARARSESMSAAAKLLADGTNVDGIAFRTHADAHLAVGQFFEEDGDDHTASRAEMVDQAFVVFRYGADLPGDFQAQAEIGDLAVCLKLHGVEN